MQAHPTAPVSPRKSGTRQPIRTEIITTRPMPCIASLGSWRMRHIGRVTRMPATAGRKLIGRSRR
ncbi:hypothetical protein DWW03_06045 [Alistipes sp. AF14-19]|nr:hypothetical protein DWW03_06045 [Alistipes sp. AF14-19]